MRGKGVGAANAAHFRNPENAKASLSAFRCRNIQFWACGYAVMRIAQKPSHCVGARKWRNVAPPVPQAGQWPPCAFLARLQLYERGSGNEIIEPPGMGVGVHWPTHSENTNNKILHLRPTSKLPRDSGGWGRVNTHNIVNTNSKKLPLRPTFNPGMGMWGGGGVREWERGGWGRADTHPPIPPGQDSPRRMVPEYHEYGSTSPQRRYGGNQQFIA